MKQLNIMYWLLLVLLLVNVSAHAQRGLGTNTPAASAILELKSTSKGFLLPRMTFDQMDAVNSPVQGLMVYSTDRKAIYLHDGSEWIKYDGEAKSNKDNFIKFNADGNVMSLESGDPNSWANYSAFELNNSAFADGYGGTFLLNNIYIDADERYRNTQSGYGSYYLQESGYHKWFSSQYSQPGSYIEFTENMRIDRAGNVGIGKKIPTGRLHIGGGTDDGSPEGDDSVELKQLVLDPPSRSGGEWSFYTRDTKEGAFLDIRYLDNKSLLSISELGIKVDGNITVNTIINTSDKRWKKKIKPLSNSLHKIAALRGVSYEWRNNQFPDKGFSDGTQVGVIAQEIEKVFPELVQTNSEGYKSVYYINLVAPLIEAVKELKQQNEKQQMVLEDFMTNNNTPAKNKTGFYLYGEGSKEMFASRGTTNTWVTNADKKTGAPGPGVIASIYNSKVLAGTIAVDGNEISFSQTSDYRLKENIQPITNASDRLMKLNPVNFAWKIDGRRIDGFLAHQVNEVVPNAVSGKKDALDTDGNPDYQSLDHSKLLPLLTAALQEVLAKIENLTKRLETIEAKMKP